MSTAMTEKWEALVREREAQDARWGEAQARLMAMGAAVVLVPRAALEAIGEACLVPATNLNPNAIRV